MSGELHCWLHCRNFHSTCLYTELSHPLPHVCILSHTHLSLGLGAVAGIAIAVAVFVVLVMVPVMFFAILLYRRTRDVSHGGIIHF